MCPGGGVLVETGIDDDADGVLDPSEVDAAVEVCDGSDGMSGSDGMMGMRGPAGMSSLIRVTQEPPSANCFEGGQKIEVGLDQNADGVLDPSEVDAAQTAYVCQPLSKPAFTQLALGGTHTCGLTTRGKVWCWGEGREGQLGTGDAASQSTPVEITGLSSRIDAIAAGSTHTCALLDTREVQCWGRNTLNQVGYGLGTTQLTPRFVPFLGNDIVQIAAGFGHTCVLTTSGGVKCWGDNAAGILGTGDTFNYSMPTDVSGLTSGVDAISGAGAHMCALMSTGGVKCWGSNFFGQLGDGSSVAFSTTPVDVMGLTSGVTQISADLHTCARLSSGGVKCWGVGSNGSLGNGSTMNQATPVDVMGLSSGVDAVEVGGLTSCALMDTGALRCWGRGRDGQRGDGTLTETQTTPVNVLGPPGGAIALGVGDRHACAITPARQAFCWGEGGLGQLGVGPASFLTEPAQVLED